MDEPTSPPDPPATADSQPMAENCGKDAWVTPVVREYGLAEATNAFSGAAGTDAVIYS